MELRGVRFARAARWAYGFQLSALPWSYEAFYDGLSRSQRFADLARASVGAFFGRRLGKAVASNDPDLVISTYPFRLRRSGLAQGKKGLFDPDGHVLPGFSRPSVVGLPRHRPPFCYVRHGRCRCPAARFRPDDAVGRATGAAGLRRHEPGRSAPAPRAAPGRLHRPDDGRRLGPGRHRPGSGSLGEAGAGGARHRCVREKRQPGGRVAFVGRSP